MNAPRFLIAIGTAVVLVASTLGASASTSAAPTSLAKKRCHLVKKKVHGKVKRVRVCTKPKPKPVPTAKNVSLSLDSARAAHASIGSAGGTVSTAAASGAAIAVSIPAGALAETTTVTITPVTGIRGVSGVRLLAGVQLEPDGTALAKPATISFTLPGNAGNAFGVAWFGSGHNVHRYPITRSGSTASIQLTHFSGAGVAQGDPGLLPKLETALTVAYAREVRPLMRQAETNDALFTPAVDAAFRWLKAVELVGLEDRFATWHREVFASLRKIFANAIEKASERCQNHDLTQLNVLAKLDQKAQSLGLEVPRPSGIERIEACARFELELDGVATMSPSGGTLEHHVHATVPIRLADAGYHGEGPLETQSLTLTHCGQGTATADGPLIVDGLTMQPGPTPPPDVALIMRMPAMQGSLSCVPGQTMTLPGPYQTVWVLTHHSEQANGFYAIRSWQWIGGAIVARKEYDLTAPVGDGAVHEHTTLVLRHTPAGP